jgi:hypothetical protein
VKTLSTIDFRPCGDKTVPIQADKSPEQRSAHFFLNPATKVVSTAPSRMSGLGDLD